MSAPFEIRIRPRSGLGAIDVREVWQYRDMIRMMVVRDFTTRYRQTVLGPLWLVFQPLMISGVFTLVFSYFAKLPTGQAPPALFYFAGLVGWNYLSQTFLTTSQLYLVQGHLFSKIYFPRLCLPLSTAIGNVFGLVVQAITVVLLALGFWFHAGSASGIAPDWTRAALVPLALLQLGLAGMGLGIGLASLTVKYRDLAHMAAFFVQVWLYITPVIYPLGSVPDKWRWIVALNPATVPVDTLRAALVGGGAATPTEGLIGFGIALFVAIAGLWFFRQTERSAVDTL